MLKFLRRTVLISASGAGIAIIYYNMMQKKVSANSAPSVTEKPATLWTPPTRGDLISRLKKENFDILVIGCGATGAGCTVDGASRGLSMACIEKNDFSSGTSSKSTKLVHGGVRYLEKAIKQLDLGQYKLVSEALHERYTFLKVAPYLASHLPIMLPIYKYFDLI